MSATDGDEIDFNEIQADIVEQMAMYSVNEVVYDPWRATQLAQGLVSEGATAVEFRNTVANMSPAMFELEAAIESKRLHHDGNPVLSWMASNVVAKIDAKDNIFPRKERPDNKIDGMVALIMAIGRLMHTETGAGLDSFLNNI
jgi:phage terminase large subunit-like protein